MSAIDIARPLIQRFEGCRLTAYLCSAGVPTIGYGATGPDIRLGMTWTQQEANERLTSDMQRFVTGVSSAVTVKLSEGRLAALVSLAFNIGLGAFKKSTLLKLVNAGKFAEASFQFLRWDKVNGKPIAGLTRRRVAEKAIWENQP